jgi:hypothetical protein
LATIASKAVQEAELKKMLMKIEREWKDLAMVVVLYKEQKDNFVLGVLDDVIAKVTMHSLLVHQVCSAFWLLRV